MKQENASLRKLAMVLEYDGSNYCGFQYQSNAPTIQDQIEMALAKVCGVKVRIKGASRTDSGAHALAQVIEFVTDIGHEAKVWTDALNYYLPWDIKIQTTYDMPLEFDSRGDAIARTYRYSILNRENPSPILYNRTAWIKQELDLQNMRKAAKSLVGTHDFKLLCGQVPEGKSTCRKVERWDIWKEGEVIVIESEANAFLPHQIRRTNGVLVEIGKNYISPKTIQELLEGSIIGHRSFPSLPAKGLCLMEIRYKDQIS
ncbi:tRNA pseudouridine(38-40) synthase TruA [SAR202 cluster bacterium AC-409-J13_OGT_754m]|nr:tRNA pseudouridine(38-40) synthase TruA [SAR202 cluster bacterium AC-409-J13_OGT_754m]